MPSRTACVAILLFWVYAAGALLRRDILPDLWLNPAPDLRSMAEAEEDTRPTQWDISVAEDSSLRNLRSVGGAVTESKRLPDGGTELLGHVWFDSGNLLKGTLIAHQGSERIDISNNLEIDKSGNLKRFRAVMRSASDKLDLLTIVGQVKGKSIEARLESPIYSLLNGTRTIPYEPRGMVQNSVGPIDRLPGLHVGQRWTTRVVNPLTGIVEVVKVEVTGKRTIQWDNTQVPTLEVVQHMTGITARTWVRKDGLVLRQELPLSIFKHLILERLPDRGENGKVGVKAP